MKEATGNIQTIRSVGVDVGTTTSQLVVSRLTIENTSPGSMVPRMEITGKEVVHQSGIYFTPLLGREQIDASSLSEIIAMEYGRAGIKPEDVDTGAVIITGETAKKENAQAILAALSGMAGEFVVATAGAHLESVFAGRGSGAAGRSREKHRIVANVDVGGGTSNIGVFKEGATYETACLAVGGRLLELDDTGRKIKKIAEPMRPVLAAARLSLQEGDMIQLDDIRLIVTLMAGAVADVLVGKEPQPELRSLLTTGILHHAEQIEDFMISGGVAEYFYSDFLPVAAAEIARYGDIGPALGWGLRQVMLERGFRMEKPLETIRATVIGAGTQSVNLSGSTIEVEPSVLPMKSIPVYTPFYDGLPCQANEMALKVQKIVQRAEEDGQTGTLAISVQGKIDDSFAGIGILADGLIAGMENYLASGRSMVVVLEADCGKILGQSLIFRRRQGLNLVCVDQLVAGEGDFIDIGSPLMGGRVVPVVIKTLAFTGG
jgi:ethanolamine utilization protein EutA